MRQRRLVVRSVTLHQLDTEEPLSREHRSDTTKCSFHRAEVTDTEVRRHIFLLGPKIGESLERSFPTNKYPPLPPQKILHSDWFIFSLSQYILQPIISKCLSEIVSGESCWVFLILPLTAADFIG